ncbi:MAG: CPBP family intramembrane metalloprotease [Cellulomonas sp.]|nr:CPBP family intramembrane glutamic endopeptidase [Cellulomonas sp.]MCR6649412.1 CPBP family intramembrane metalloprotease [Cellulomonas sp.]
MALLLIAGLQLAVDDGPRSRVTVAIGLSLSPMGFGLAWGTPAVGVVCLALALRPRWRELFSRTFPRSAVWISVLSLSGLAVFIVWQGSTSGRTGAAISWNEPTRPDLPIGLVVTGVVLVAVVNSLFEEFLWRAGMADMLAPRDSTAAPWLIMVSLGFGLSHLYGTPGGWTGVVATACFGLAMAALRFCCRGSILLCVAVHAIADLVLLGMLYV